MDGQQHNATYDFSAPVQPVAVASWRGAFNIPNKNVDISVVAHVSNKACMKVLEVANIMPESLRLEMVSRLDVWPALFRSSPPTEHSMALFFFPDGRDGELLDSVIAEAVYSDFAFRAMIGETELLIFTSVQLPKKLHRLLGKHYLWGVFRGQPAAPSHQSDYHVHIQNPRMKQETYMNSGNHRSFEGCSPVNFSIEQSPSSYAAKSDKRGRHLDDAWIHAKPLDELRQKSECRYCGFVSSHGGISRLKAHLGGGIATIHLPGCHKVSPEIKRVMADWFNEWVKTTKAVWAKGLRAESSAHDDRRENLHGFTWEQHAKPVELAGKNRTESKYFGFVSFDGGVSHYKLNLGVRDQKMHMDTWPNASPEVKGNLPQKVKKSKASKPREMKGLMSEWVNDMDNSKTKKPEADSQVERRGRPLDDAWKHAKALDAARQKTQCKHCGFVSSYGGISRLKAHLGGGCPQMQLQGCSQVPPEVKQVMEQWFTEWSKTSSAAWTKNSAPAKSCKRGNPADEDMWEHAIPLDELGQTTRCKYCGFVSKCGGIDRLKAHLCGGDPAMQLEGCPNVPTTLLRAFMTEKNKKHKKKSKGVSMEQP
ncbi:uncharacterized protein LOC127257174 isoform X2 [Andrographis paniculata]|nr:uncharacterized protein LOC127257174 isoform X2 [Andrographis paniculata]